MKKHSDSLTQIVLSVGFALLSLGSLAARAGEEACTMGGKPLDRNLVGALDGKTGLLKCVDKSTGVVEEEQEYRNGKPMGRHLFRRGDITVEENTDERGNWQGVRKHYEGGKLSSEINYKDSQMSGLNKEYWDNGKLKSSSWHADDSFHSISYSVSYSKDGKVTSISCHNASKPGDKLGLELCGYEGHPSKVETYGFDGALKRTFIFQNGQQVEKTLFDDKGKVAAHEVSTGDSKKVTENYPDGKLKAEAEYKGRFLNGTQKEYHSSGKLVRKTTWDEGRMTSEEEYYLNGNVKSKAQLKKDGDTLAVTRQIFADNGQIIEDGVFADKVDGSNWKGFRLDRWTYAVPVGLHRKLSEEGVLLLSEPYDREGRLQGVSKSFYPNSKPLSEAEYDKGVLKWRKTWDKDGKQTEDEEFFEDGSRKSRGKKTGKDG